MLEKKGDKVMDDAFEQLNEHFDEVIAEEKDDRMDLDTRTKAVSNRGKRQKVEVDDDFLSIPLPPPDNEGF